MEFEHELRTIKEKREKLYKLDAPIALCLITGLVSQYFIPAMAPVFGIAAFALFYHRLYRTAHTPCPRCKAPFGSSAKVILGPGSNECQNCKLELHATKS